MKKNLGITIILLVIMFFSAATGSFAADLKMAGSDWPVWETAHGMAAMNKLDGFSFSYEKYGTCINGFALGKYDITFMTLYDFIAIQRDNPIGVIIAATDYSAGGDGVILRSDVGSAQELKGKTVGLQADSISLYIAELYLNKYGLSLEDIRISNIKGEMVSKAFAANKSLAGVVGWNPNLDDAVAAGGKKVATSADFHETVFDVIVVNRDSLAKNRSLYIDFLKKWFGGVNDAEVTAKSAGMLNVSADEFGGWLQDAFIYKKATDSFQSIPRMKAVANDIQDFLNKKPSSVKGKAATLFGNKPIDLNQLVDDSLLSEISK